MLLGLIGAQKFISCALLNYLCGAFVSALGSLPPTYMKLIEWSHLGAYRYALRVKALAVDDAPI